MKKLFKSLVAVLLTVTMLISGSINLLAAGADALSRGAGIVSTDMSLDGAKSNVREYYSNDEWKMAYPEGYFIVEYSSYEVMEGGVDSENPEDVYLGIKIYRVGGNSTSSAVTYSLTCVNGDEEAYPSSLGTVEFMPQAKTAVARIKIKDNDKRDGEQLLLFSLCDATTGTISDAAHAAVKIVDDEPYVDSVITVFAENAVTDKSEGGVKLTVKREDNATDVCSFRVKTVDDTAKAGVDYEAVDEEIVLTYGETEKEIIVPVKQTDEKFTDARYFNVSLSDLKGCVSSNDGGLRFGITNNLENEAKILTEVDGHSADLSLDEGESLTDSAESVINVNDDIDRADVLRTAIGAVNGTAVQTVNKEALFSSADESGYWDGSIELPNTAFEQRYHTGNSWTAGSTYTDGNEDLMVSSIESFDLNMFDSVSYEFRNEEYRDISGNPNTAFGYLTTGGYSDTDVKYYFIKHDLTNGSESDYNWMRNHDMYFLKNWNNTNFNNLGNPITATFYNEESGERYPNTYGLVGSEQKIFYIAYDDEGWDDTHFDLGTTTLNRTVIPFSVFDTSAESGITNFKINIDESNKDHSTITFDMNEYSWTLSVDYETGGGVAVVPGTNSSAALADRYGFYVGTNLKVSFKRNDTAGGSSVSVPQYLYLKDSNGVIHNTAAVSEGEETYFIIPMSTIMSTNVEDLTRQHYMTNDEAYDHVNYAVYGNTINSAFDGKLRFEATFSLKQRVVLDFKNLPHLYNAKTLSDKTVETDDDHEVRVYSALKNVVTFYDGEGNTFVPDYKIDLMRGTMTYSSCEFSRIHVSPESAGAGTMAKSNLYDLEFNDFAGAVDIPISTCTQISNDVTFTLHSENASYLIPGITMQTAAMARLVDGAFVNEYVANPLEEYIPFEAFYSDVSETPDISYYAVSFVISDIYVGTKKGEVKEFNVNVYYDKTSATEPKKLLSFNFLGGANYDQASDVEFTYVNSGYFKTNEDNEYKEYMPKIELVDYSSNGYEYILYIPSYYNRVSGSDGMDQYYPLVFEGADGISIEMNDYKKGDGEGEKSEDQQIISAVDVIDTQYICQQIPNINTDSEGGAASTHYFEEQEQYYTYNDHVAALVAFDFSVDWSGLPMAISKILKYHNKDSKLSKVGALFAGTGPYVQVGTGTITAGYRINASLGTSLLSSEEEADLASLGSGNPVSHKSWRETSNSKLGMLTGTVGLDAKIKFTYNELTHRYVLTMFSIGFNGAFGLSLSAPIPCTANLLYATFSVRIGVNITGSGMRILDYVDDGGKEHYHIAFAGITVTPNFAVSGGVGFGLSGLLSIEGGISFDTSLSLSIGMEKHVPVQMEYDIDNVASTTPMYSYSFDGDWRTYASGLQTEGMDKYIPDDYYTFCYGNTMCRTEQVGDKLTVVGVGTSFHLMGAKEPCGGKIRVGIKDKSGNVLMEDQEIDLYADNVMLYQTLLRWNKGGSVSSSADNVQFVVTIEHIASDKVAEGARVSLDSIRIYNEKFSKDNSKTLPSVISAANVHLGMYVSLCIIGLNFKLEPAYMMVNQKDTTWTDDKGKETVSLTMGTIAYSHTWTWELQNEEADAPVLMVAAPLRGASLSDPEYFDTGEYAEYKKKTLLKSDIDNTVKTQVLSYNGSEYSFYTVLEDDGGEGGSFYRLYYSKNDVDMGPVCDDVFVADFNAFVDGDGVLTVQTTSSDSTVKSVIKNAEGKVIMTISDGTEIDLTNSKNLSEALKRTCLKVCTYNDGTASFEEPLVIDGTDGNGVQESIPTATSTTDIKGASDKSATVMFFVEDTKTEVKAENDLNWTAFNNETASTDETVNAIINSMYEGKSTLSYSVKGENGYGEKKTVDLDQSFSGWEKPGFKITSIDAVMKDSNTVCIAYSAELPYASLDSRTGVQKEIHYRTATIGDDGSLTFGDIVVVDAIFDYDDDITDVFTDVENIPSRYRNEDSGEVFDHIVLSDVQFESAAMYENGESASVNSCEPCLFYRTNKSINYVEYTELSQMENGESAGVVKVFYDGSFDDYVIVPDEKGSIYLIYNDMGDNEEYADTLYILEYNSQDKVWNSPRQLTHSEAFDREAFENCEPTAAVMFDCLSAYIDSNGKVSVAFKSSFVPFSYEYGTNESMLQSEYDVNISDYYDYTIIDDNGDVHQYIRVPVQDFESEYARTDIFKISFENKVNALEVSNFELFDEIFVKGREIFTTFDIKNVGDSYVDGMNVSLYYYYLSNNSKETLATQKLSGKLLAGDTYRGEMSYVIGDKAIPDNTVLCVEIKDGAGRRVLYDSYEASYKKNTDGDPSNDTHTVYRHVTNLAELYFDGIDVEIDANGIMSYTLALGNAGRVDVKDDILVYCNAYHHNAEAADYELIGTMFSMTVPKEKLTKNTVTYIYDKFKVGDYFDGDTGELYYSFRISTTDAQYSTENDNNDIEICRQTPEIQIDDVNVLRTDVHSPANGGLTTKYLRLGDVIEIDRKVLSSYLKNYDVRAYEIGTSCLSIDNTTSDEKIYVKVVDLPEGKEGYVKILFNITGTVVYKYMYLHVSNTDMIDLREGHSDGNWEQSPEIYVCAVNFDKLSTVTDQSTVSFDFIGKSLKLYGDMLTMGGDLKVEILDEEGNTVSEDTISTRNDLDDNGMLLYSSEELAYAKYSVKLTALLEEGEMVSLDYAKFVIDTSGVDTEPFVTVEKTEEALDAPTYSGRERRAEYTVTFDKPVELCKGKSLGDIVLTFDEYESIDGEFVSTGESVQFAARELKDEKILVFESALSSKSGVVMKYVLSDGELPEGVLVSKNGKEIDRTIPDYENVSYTLKESGIMSVIVADDETMPDGSVHKSVHVKFMTAPDVERLLGTKLLYKTSDADNVESAVEFVYSGMTDDPRTAVYKAEKLELSESEITKIFSFEEGIILGENNYVLVTSEGDYLENDVTTVIGTKEDIDIIYHKLKAESAPVIEAEKTEEGYLPRVTVSFYEDVVEAEGAYIKLSEKISAPEGEITENELILEITTSDENSYTLTFADANARNYSTGDRVEYSLVSEYIEYAGEGRVKRAYDMINIDPALENAESLAFNVGAYIEKVSPYFDGGYKNSENVLLADVVFSDLIDIETLTDTTLSVTEISDEYGEDRSRTLLLTLLETREEEGKTVATYKYVSDTDEITLTYDERAKTYIVSESLGIPEGNVIRSIDGEDVLSGILSAEKLIFERTSAVDAYTAFAINEDGGYDVELYVIFEDDVTVQTVTNVWTNVPVDSNMRDGTVGVALESVSENVLKFVADTPISLRSGEIASFNVPEMFEDVAQSILDEKGIPVSRKIKGSSNVAFVDMTGKGTVQSATIDIESTDKNVISVTVKVAYNESLRELSFENSSIVLEQLLTYADGTQSNAAADMSFTGIEEGSVAVFTCNVTVPDEADSVEFSLGDAITNTTGTELYNENRTIALDAAIPEGENANVTKMKAESVSFECIGEDGVAKDLSDIAFKLTYPEAIEVNELTQVTVQANVTGVVGYSEITLRATALEGENTIVFVPEDVEAPLANVVRISLDGEGLAFNSGSVTSIESGLMVSKWIPDCSAAFNLKPTDIPIIPDGPVYDPDDTTVGVEETTAEKETTVETDTTVSKTTDKETIASSDSGKDDKKDTPLTGDSFLMIVSVLAIAILAIAVILIVFRKKRA